jgi:plastocyanin
MRKLILLLAAVALLAAATVTATASAGDPAAHAASTRSITLGDNFFSPKSVTVRKGTTLKFYWGEGNVGTDQEHNVTGVKGNKFASEDTSRPDTPFRKKITKTTLIVCTIHSTTMKLSVKVKK